MWCVENVFCLSSTRHSLWRVGIWKENQRPPTAAVQGCLQERHEITPHQHRVLGGPCSRQHDVEKHSEPTPQVRGREVCECRSRKKGLQKGAQQLQQTRDLTQMRLLRQRLLLPHRSLQPQATLQKLNRQWGRNSSVGRVLGSLSPRDAASWVRSSSVEEFSG